MPESFDDDQSLTFRDQKFNSLFAQAHEQQSSHPALAIDLLQQALALIPHSPPALRLCGRICQDSTRWQEAAQCFKTLTEDEPDDCAAWIDLGFCLEPMGDFEGAYAAYTKASEVDDSDAIGLNNRGYLQMGRGQLEDALRDVEAALARDPNEGIVYATKAEVLTQMARYEEAFVALEQAIKTETEWLDTADNSEFLANLREQSEWDIWIARIHAMYGSTAQDNRDSELN